MASIVDELIVQFSLDPSKFTKGQQELLDGLDKTKDRVRKDGNEIERHAKNMAEGFQSVVRAVGALTAGYFTASSMTSFLQQTIQTNVAVHQLGTTIGVTAERLGQYRQAAKAAGISPEAMTQSIVSSTGALNAVASGQAGGNFWQSYAKLGVKGPLLDASGKPIPVEEYLRRVQEAVHETQRSGRYSQGQITSFLADLGINSETAYVLEQTNRSLDRFLEEARKMKTVSNEGAGESQKLKESYGDLTNAVDVLANAVMRDLNPGLQATLKWLKEIVQWFTDHRRIFEIIAGIVAGATAGAAIGTVIPGVGTGLGAIAGGIAGGITGGTLPNRGGEGRTRVWVSPEGAQSNPGAGAGMQGSEYLRARRERFAQEIRDKPWLKSKLAAVLDLENPGAGPAVIESLMNRMDYTGGTLESGLGLNNRGRSFYGPVRRGQDIGREQSLLNNPRRLEQLYGYIDQALAGSNLVRGHTDQGSAGDPNYIAGGTGVNINRERFNDWGGGPGGHAGARRFREEQQRRVLQGAPSSPFNDRFGTWGGAGSGSAWPTPWLNNPAPFVAPGQTTNDNRRSSSISIGNISVATAAQNANDLVNGLDNLLRSRFSTVQATTGLA